MSFFVALLWASDPNGSRVCGVMASFGRVSMGVESSLTSVLERESGGLADGHPTGRSARFVSKGGVWSQGSWITWWCAG